MTMFDYSIPYAKRRAQSILIKIPVSICRDFSRLAGFDILIYSYISYISNYNIHDVKLVSGPLLYSEIFYYNGDTNMEADYEDSLIDKISASLEKLVSLGYINARVTGLSESFYDEEKYITYELEVDQFANMDEKYTMINLKDFTYFLDNINIGETEDLFVLYLYILSMRGLYIKRDNKWIASFNRSKIDSVFGEDRAMNYLDILSRELNILYYEIRSGYNDLLIVCSLYQDRDAVHHYIEEREKDDKYKKKMNKNYYTLISYSGEGSPFSAEELQEMKEYFVDYNEKLRVYQENDPKSDYLAHTKNIDIINHYLTYFN